MERVVWIRSILGRIACVTAVLAVLGVFPASAATPTPDGAGDGFAKLSVSAGCPSKVLRISVRGRGVANVSYWIDHRKIMTVIAPDARGRFRLNWPVRKLSFGAHKVYAQVTYTAASATASEILKAYVQRCRPITPKFAG